MSDAVDHAEAMLSCISLAYKESASERAPCRGPPWAEVVIATPGLTLPCV